MKVAVLTPAFDHTHPDLDRLLMGAALPWLVLRGHSDLPRARSMLLEEGLGKGAERILLIDADTIPSTVALREMVSTELVTPARAVWGLYPLREGDRWNVHPEVASTAMLALAKGEPFPIISGGLGFCAIHRESLVRLAAGLPELTEDTGSTWHPFCVPFVKDGQYYADDGSLCWRLRDSGTELWCDPRLRAGHAVSRIIREIRASAKDTAVESTPSRAPPGR